MQKMGGWNGKGGIIKQARRHNCTEVSQSTFPNSPLSKTTNQYNPGTAYFQVSTKMDSLHRFQLVAEFEVSQSLFDGFIEV